eukprot:TRINITY_DN19815_c0_g1_i1.p1 TRINITY_DN19815_c0_g1~~TRINITY_DN19815_c0_g1_i1.p1  ORF type:complete len:378 (+),score=139.75 TRINITY_DN19815_c0_g1_i1:39-1136(+)
MQCLLVAALAPLCIRARRTTWRDLEANPGYTFRDYLQEYGKAYPAAGEFLAREAIFAKNLREIREHNAAGHSWKMGLNQFSDWEDSEVRSRRTGGIPVPESDYLRLHKPSTRNVSQFPAMMDWRAAGVVTPIKDQGGCGSCWAFSATETIETYAALDTGITYELSPQQLVSCAPNPQHCGGTGGCAGSTMKLAFNYTADAGGLSLEKTYPYRAETLKCDKSKIDPVVTLDGFVGVPTNDYAALMDVLANVGPVSVMIAAGFAKYEEGVYSGNCGWTVDHGVQLVGYGSDDGNDYWLIRNSWGLSWGEKGYIRIKRFGEGSEPCGLDQKPQAGVACKGQVDPIEYCGLCAMFCSASYPTGVRGVAV